MSQFSFQINITDNFLHIKLTGRIIEKEQTDALLEEVSDLISNDCNKVVLDLEYLDYINSNGLNSFINILTKTRNVGGETVVINVPEKIKKLLIISKLNTVFTIKDGIEEANEILN